MEEKCLTPWKHAHTFGQETKRSGEARTLLVIGITASMMIIEIVCGLAFGSMALLADGLHMASHAAALSINAFAYVYARRHAGNEAFSFGTGKVNALGGFTGAVLLACFALLMAGESVHRLIQPVQIVFDQAILVAVLGLIVNGICVVVLGGHHHHDGGDHDHHGGHGHLHPSHDHDHDHAEDHNLRSAYLHVLADALTSILAIVALLTAKFAGAYWMDPMMGIVGAALVSHWSFGLLRATSRVLLDRQAPAPLCEQIRRELECDGDSRVTDLHLWSIGSGLYALIATVVATAPKDPDEYKARLPDHLGLAHVSIEVNPYRP